MTAAWDEYLNAARRLDAVRRKEATARAAEVAAAQEVGRELAALHRRIGVQRMRLLDVAGRAGLADPLLTGPQAAVRDGAGQPVNARTTPSTGAASHVDAVRAVRERLDAAAALLSAVDGSRMSAGPLVTWPPMLRNALVYGGFALLVLVVQVILFLVAPNGAASVLALGCAVVLPVIGFGLAWLGVGIVFKGERVDRTPVLGAVISAAPILVFCTGLLTAAAMH